MRTRLGLKVLGLSALVMGVMAIGTTGAAQAEAGSCFSYLAPALTCFGALEPKAEVKFENNTGTLLIANVNLEVLCTTAKFIEGGQLGGTGVLLGKVQFEGCVSLSKTPSLTKLNSCTPKDPVAGVPGTIRTEKGFGLIVLHNGEPVLKLSPDTGKTLAKIFLGEECAVSEELIVEGHLVVQDTPGKRLNHENPAKEVELSSKGWFELHAPSHLIQEHSILHLMTVGVNSATIDGTGIATLEGTHSALNWAGHAG